MYEIIDGGDTLTVTYRSSTTDWLELALIHGKVVKTDHGPGEEGVFMVKKLIVTLISNIYINNIFTSLNDLEKRLDMSVINLITEEIKTDLNKKGTNYAILSIDSNMGILNIKAFKNASVKERQNLAPKILTTSNIHNIPIEVIKIYESDFQELSFLEGIRVFNPLTDIENHIIKTAGTDISLNGKGVLSEWYGGHHHFSKLWVAIRQSITTFSQRHSMRVSITSICAWILAIPFIYLLILMNPMPSPPRVDIILLISFAVIWVGILILNIFWSSLKPLIVRGNALDYHIQLLLLLLSLIGISKALTPDTQSTLLTELSPVISMWVALGLIIVVRRHQEADWVFRLFPFYTSITVANMIWTPHILPMILPQIGFSMMVVMIYIGLDFLPNVTKQLELLNHLDPSLPKQTIPIRPRVVTRNLKAFTPQKIEMTPEKHVYHFTIQDSNKWLVVEVLQNKSPNRIVSFITESICESTSINLVSGEDVMREVQLPMRSTIVAVSPKQKKLRKKRSKELKKFKKKKTEKKSIKEAVAEWIDASTDEVITQIEELNDSELIELLSVLMTDKDSAKSFARLIERLNNNKFYKWNDANNIMDIKTGLIGGLYCISRISLFNELLVYQDSARYFDYILKLYNRPESAYFKMPPINVEETKGEEDAVLRYYIV
ncbi:MAG: hypothetical protein AB1665_07770 [Candidatus Thermoplasmatota archaeon]